MRRHGSIKIQEGETKQNGLQGSLDHLHDELRYPLDHLRRVATVERQELEAVDEALHALLLERVQMTSPRAVGNALVDRAQRRCRPRTHGTRRQRRHTIHLVRRDTEDIRYREQDRRAIRVRESLLDLVLQALVSSESQVASALLPID